MPYGNYSYVIDSTFRPFSFSEMMAPISMYKDAYEKSEETYNNLLKEADTFKYLSEELPEDSKARQIYERYVNDVRKQAEDLQRNGLNVMNRSALTGLRNRYHGEIGLLNKYQTQLDELVKGRNALQAKGVQMLYGDENPTIDSLMSGFDRYGIDSDELYKRGALAGKAASSKEYKAGDDGSTLNGMYRVWKEQKGIQDVDGFLNTEEAQRGIDDILRGTGAMEHLSGKNLEKARQEIINGIRDGIIYEESSKPVRDASVLSAQERASKALQWANHNESVRQHNLQLRMRGYDENGVYHQENDQELKKAEAVANAKIPRDANGNPIQRSTQKSTTWKPKEPRIYDGKGSQKPLIKTQNTSYGQSISFAEAVEIDPAIANHDPGHEDDYEYFKRKDGGVAIVGLPQRQQNSQGQASSSEDSDEHNEF